MFFQLTFSSRTGSRIEISGWYSVHPAQNCVTELFHVQKKGRFCEQNLPLADPGPFSVRNSALGDYAPEKSKKNKFSEWFCLVGKMIAHPGRVFLSYLEGHSSHIRQFLFLPIFIYNPYIITINRPGGLYVMSITSIQLFLNWPVTALELHLRIHWWRCSIQHLGWPTVVKQGGGRNPGRSAGSQGSQGLYIKMG